MPKSSIPANGNRVPSLTRRSLLAGMASAAAGVPASAAIPPPDAAVSALAQTYTDALATYEAAERHRTACERRYLAECPDPPAALTHAGPLGKLLASKWTWWDADDLKWLLKDRAQRQHWRAARKLLAVAREAEAADRRFAAETGLPAAEAAQRAASEALDALADAILALPAETAAALALKARVVKTWGKPEWWSCVASHADVYERMAAQVMDAAMGHV
jgi:hypothetical protein